MTSTKTVNAINVAAITAKNPDTFMKAAQIAAQKNITGVVSEILSKFDKAARQTANPAVTSLVYAVNKRDGSVTINSFYPALFGANPADIMLAAKQINAECKK